MIIMYSNSSCCVVLNILELFSTVSCPPWHAHFTPWPQSSYLSLRHFIYIAWKLFWFPKYHFRPFWTERTDSSARFCSIKSNVENYLSQWSRVGNTKPIFFCHNRLISAIEFTTVVRRHLYIGLGPGSRILAKYIRRDVGSSIQIISLPQFMVEPFSGLTLTCIYQDLPETFIMNYDALTHENSPEAIVHLSCPMAPGSAPKLPRKTTWYHLGGKRFPGPMVMCSDFI